MTLKSLKAGLLSAALACGAWSCGGNDPSAAQNSSRDRGQTLAGAADTTKAAANRKAQGEVRVPDAPVERPAAVGTGALTGPGAPAITPGALGPQATAGAAGNVAAGADLSDMPSVPKDARWTIYCGVVAEPGHVEAARELKQKLIGQTKMTEWYLVHEQDRSRLYYGYYRSIDDPADAKESARAKSDRKKIDELKDAATGARPFPRAQFVQLNAPDPASPPQWNLVNAPPSAVWTLVVGAYKDSPDRKEAAVEAVRTAREQFGEEAYYYHGPVVSNVCIGAFPADAVLEKRDDPDPTASKNGAGDVFVLPPGMKAPPQVRDKQGRRVRAVSMQLVPVDPKLKATIEKYPTMGMNGAELITRIRGVARAEPSHVIEIPRPGDTLFRDNVAAANAEAQQGPAADEGGVPNPFARPGVVDNRAQQQPSDQPAGAGDQAPGRLRSLGGKR